LKLDLRKKIGADIWPKVYGLILLMALLVLSSPLTAEEACDLAEVNALKESSQLEPALQKITALLQANCLPIQSQVEAHILRIILAELMSQQPTPINVEAEIDAIFQLDPRFECRQYPHLAEELNPAICERCQARLAQIPPVAPVEPPQIPTETPVEPSKIPAPKAGLQPLGPNKNPSQMRNASPPPALGWWYFLPFGVGQYANQQEMKGSLCLAGEMIGLGVAIYLHIGQERFFDDYQARLNSLPSEEAKADYRQAVHGNYVVAEKFKLSRDLILVGLGFGMVGGILEGIFSAKSDQLPAGASRVEPRRSSGRLIIQPGPTQVMAGYGWQF
jgi:hypothetical protein